MANGVIIRQQSVGYKEYSVSVSPNSNVPPYTYYAAFAPDLPSNAIITGVACLVADSSARAIATIRSTLDTGYVYSFTSSAVTVRVSYILQ